MRTCITSPFKIGFFLILFGVSLLWADVKLRIYLQDGTLQAGNLVAETPESFVILNKEERLEIKKDKIMFINGKTLKQWEERPDKFFQTEIIPSEIPNPAYVNDKAAIPTLPPPVTKVEPVKVVPEKKSVDVPKEKPASKSPPSVTTSAVPPAPQAPPQAVPPPTPVVEPVKPMVQKTVVPAAIKAEAPKGEVITQPQYPNLPPKRRRRKKPQVVESASVEGVVPPVVAQEQIKSSPEKGRVPPGRFNRKEYAEFYFDRAKKYVETGSKGKALQDLHLATVLDRQTSDPVVLLGQLYMREGLSEKAKKYFSIPLVRKLDIVKTWTEQMEHEGKKTKQAQWILYGATAVGTLVWIPLLWGWRALKKPSQTIITADEISDKLLESPLPPQKPIDKDEPPGPTPEVLEQAIQQVDTEWAGLKDLAMIKDSETRAELPKPPTQPLQPPSAFPPSEKKPEQSIKPVSLQPDVPRVPIEPIVPPPLPPPIIPPAIPPPLPVVEAVPVSEKPHVPEMDVESVLRMASQVETAVRKGNGLVLEGQEDLARREYRTALVLNPACVEAHLGLGYLCFAKSQWDLALEHYARALSIDSNSADAHYGVGRVFLETDKIDEAILEFQKTLSLDPAFDDARETLTALGVMA
ncbi:MAG: hypothetical protein KCHDKBKB_02918 [Elusimicrobia bacterium]|nr:hypothetical protein [Elusimicrobiota bacterium]